MVLDQTAQIPPRDDGFYLAQEALAPRLLMVSLKTNAVKGHLTHGDLAGRLNQIKHDSPRSTD
jgi:hypothetical protein